MSAETRICLCPCGRDLDRDFDPPMNKGAVVGRDSKCRNWLRNRKKTCDGPGGCPVAVGRCHRCGKYNLQPRGEHEVRRRRHISHLDEYGNARTSGPAVRQLRTRLLGQVPEHAPRPEHFIKPDGTLLYEDARKKLTLNQRKWLNKVAPDPDYVKRPNFERTSKHYQPLRRSGGENIYIQVWDSPDAPDRDIFRWRDLRDRGINVEELPAYREWHEWQGREKNVKPDPELMRRKRQVARLQERVAEARAEARAVAAEKSGNRQAA
jgi:hypothetical protein